MRITLLSLGTLGDVALMATLGQRLASRGAQVTLAASPFYASHAEEAGLGFERVGSGGFEQMRDALAAAMANALPAQRTEAFFKAWVLPQLTEGDAGLTRLVEASDYFVSNLKIVRNVGSRATPTARVTYDPPHSLDDLNRFGPVRPEVIDLVALPRELIDPEGRCEPRFEFTGFWLPEEQTDAEVAQELERFVAAGEDDILAVTLGSMPVGDPQDFTSVASRAARDAGLRCVLVGAWSGVESGAGENGDLLIVLHAPYDWLFARSRCVVHHGSTGATSIAIRTGTPSVVVPFLSCQHDMGSLLCAAGLASGVVPGAFDDPDSLAEAVAMAATDQGLRENAGEWSLRMNRERGADQAAQRVFEHHEQLFG